MPFSSFLARYTRAYGRICEFLSLISRKSTLDLMALIVCGIWIVLAIVRVLHEMQYSIFERYIASQWLVTYEWGFVRRALPGQVLTLFGDYRLQVIDAAAWLPTLVGIAALLLTVKVVAQSALTGRKLVVVVIAITSPLSISLLIHDVGRFDGFLIALFALNIVIARVHSNLLWFMGMVAIGVSCILISEFAFLYLIPITIVSFKVREDRPYWYGGLALFVFVSLGIASLKSPLSDAGLESILALGIDGIESDGAAYWLSESAPGLGQLSFSLGPWMAPSLLAFISFYLAPALAISLSMGSRVSNRWSLIVLWLLLVAVIGSVAAYDARRYFGIAFIVLLIVAALEWEGRGQYSRVPPSRADFTFTISTIVSLVMALIFQSLPLTHITAEDWKRILTFLA